MSKLWQSGRNALQGFRILKIGLNPDRPALYARLNQRAALMFDQGLVEETAVLLERYPQAWALSSLGYRQATLLANCPLGPAGTIVRGHEFHYARIIEPGNDAPLADMADGEGRPLGPSGARRGNVSGTFFHAIARG